MARVKKAKPRAGTPIPLDAICDFIDWQTDFYAGDDRKALIKASNALYDHLHKDDPPERYGN